MPGKHELIVGLGDRRYRIERPFGTWPANAGFVTDVAVDARGHVFAGLRHDPLTQADDPRIIELTPDGGFVRGWGETLIADTHLFTIASDGRFLILDRDMHELVITSRDGDRIGGLGTRGKPFAPFNHPSDVGVAANGDMFVSDGYAAHWMHHFAADGTYIKKWGGFGREPGQFMEPHSLWVFADGRIAVVDRVNDRVQVFDAEGRLLDIWTDFYRPIAIWGDEEGNAFITDTIPCLHMIARDGTRIGRCRPVLNGAHGLFGTPQGDIFLAEGNPSRISVMRRVA